MKKYLMIGFAAIAFASCSNHDIETMSQEQIIKAQYEANFVAQFGQPASNQDWGFGSSTRAFTRGVFANGNEWAANDRDDCKYRVPPRLTDDQIKIVRIYFQNVKDPGYDDPQWTDYFIQQVYKGGDTPGPNSTETYKAADNQTYLTGSDNMNHLAAVNGTFVDHNNNFNHGDCGNGYPNVLDFKGTLTTVEETYSVNDQTHRHSDKINLMTNSTTKSFGYYNSNSSLRRTEYTGLVKWSTIKTWADANGHAGEADCLEDGWNRSFMGFDFEMLIDNELYAKNADGTIKYLTYGDMPDAQYTWDGESTYGGPRPAADEFVTDVNGNKIPVLNSSTNMYAGTNGDIDQNQIITSHSCLSGYQTDGATGEQVPYYQNQNCLNTKVLFDKVNNGYCLVDGSKGCKWVKIGGTADHYYSDWIVTLTEAKKYDVPTITYQGRIMAEDLSAQYDPTGKTSDWDFNDVVFDWAIKDGKAYIKLLAAGGTLPLTIGGQLVDGVVEGGVEVHNNVNGLKGYMKNCGVGDEVPATEFVLEDHIYTDAKNILIAVYKGGTWVEIEAEQGEPAAKFNCKVGTRWCDEYVNINRVYPDFTTWVTNPATDWTHGDGSTSRLTDKDLTNNE